MKKELITNMFIIRNIFLKPLIDMVLWTISSIKIMDIFRAELLLLIRLLQLFIALIVKDITWYA